MSEQGKSSIGINNDAAANVAAWLLANYYFDLRGYQACELVESWLNHYPGNWLRLAVIEALYQGRYKAVSVEQILMIWQRRNQALYHFNYEFETLICSKLPAELTQMFSIGLTSTAASQSPSFDSELTATENFGADSQTFAGFSQPTPALTKPSLPPIEPQDTQPSLTELLSPDLPFQTSSFDAAHQHIISPEEEEAFTTENLDTYFSYSDRSTKTYPFPDLFTKLKALALQHQELINQQQIEI